jgi:hypothetical protein
MLRKMYKILFQLNHYCPDLNLYLQGLVLQYLMLQCLHLGFLHWGICGCPIWAVTNVWLTYRKGSCKAGITLYWYGHQIKTWDKHAYNYRPHTDRLPTYLPNSAEQSPWEANNHLNSQEILHCVHYSPPLVLNPKANPFHILTLYYLKSQLNIILSSMPWSSKRSLSFRFSNQDIVYFSSHPCPTCLTHLMHTKLSGVCTLTVPCNVLRIKANFERTL